ncbi:MULTISPECIES: MFS transporter [Actinosynnema]|uniref:MFS transporter n=1 Tax=Actinosynnema TaxID=40566 RepID=UPI0020A5BC26|nr:MFS transporter [Actinosynnema pretiosum]MCP2099805.1 putative arabinose efflux permease, MFS family [Actinosynnema pretiosum]
MAPTLWRSANFRNLWFAQTVSLVGTQVTLLALPLLALLVLDASAFEISLLAAIEFLPVLLLGLPAGAWIERLPLRPVLIATDVLRGVALLAVPLAAALDVLSMPLLFAVAFAIGIGTLFFDVAQLSYLPDLVAEDRLVDANGKLELSRSVSQLGGPGVGGFLVQIFTAPIALLVDAVSYLVSALFLLRIKGPVRRTVEPENLGLRKEIAEGFRFVFGHPLLRPLILCAALAELAFAAVLALQVVFAADELGLSPGVTGVVLAIGNAGGLISALLAGPISQRLGTGPTFIASIVLFSAGAAMLPMASGAVLFGAGLFVVYLGAVLFNVLQVSLCQVVTPIRLLGRMNSVFRFVTWGMVPLGAALGGALVEPVGLRGVFWGAAIITALSIIPPLLSPVRTFRESESAEPGESGDSAESTEDGAVAVRESGERG